MAFISNNQTPIVLKPGKESLNFPATFITPEFAAVLSSSPFSVPFMGGNHFNAAALFEMLIKSVTITGFIANKFVSAKNWGTSFPN